MVLYLGWRCSCDDGDDDEKDEQNAEDDDDIDRGSFEESTYFIPTMFCDIFELLCQLF